mmetsp:Transcript_19783/g.34047  ORF Transcript_19783/g.34047 Transcript_19783/m.34047 type:complete len:447 (-) Transcript_19783:1262-2602(-)|eukprot:CAMPEP_0196663416 /NCGR_PEP_ID=MMETSP1086-20130531/52759_1 /TAXON_ID=77921 /ORGANISM="Cyanoptyche  gloeocystis , Strain SAG4.97" /LENGTH=446 /DNA_ID=CAMNT_0041999217 /DNA_START=75 /DNA_END=1415 /DNA_ORIENTATION=+
MSSLGGLRDKLLINVGADSAAIGVVPEKDAGNENSTEPPLSTVPDPEKQRRRIALERLRAFLITFVVIFHIASEYCTNALVASFSGGLNSDFFGHFSFFIGGSRWPMLFFYALAGFAAFHSLKSRSTTNYFLERSFRLLPAILFGAGVLGVLQNWVCIQVFSDFGYSSLADIYGDFRYCFYGETDLCSGFYVLGSLWYLLGLYCISLCMLPFLLVWRTFSPPALSSSTSVAVATLFLVAILSLVVSGLQPLFVLVEEYPFLVLFRYNNIFAYLVFFLFGYGMAWCRKLEDTLWRLYPVFLGLALGFVVVIELMGVSTVESAVSYWPDDVWALFLAVFFATYVVYSVWVISQQTLPYVWKPVGRVLDYIAARAIAIYVLHAFCIRSVEAILYLTAGNSIFATNVYARFFAELVLAYASTLVLYEALFRYKWTKVLVGMYRYESSRKS